MLRIKVAIYDNDETYVNRLASAFNTNYQDKLEVYSFTDKNLAIENAVAKNVDVFLAVENSDIDINEVPSKCAFAYFTALASVDTIDNQKAICKYQKVDLIYKEILALFSEKASYKINVSGNHDGNTKIISFVSFAGGVGTSTLAVAYALRLASNGENVIYLNFESTGGAGYLLTGDGNMNMSDVIYSLKSKKANLSLKIESAVKKSTDGVNFIDTSNLALDMCEMNFDDMVLLIDTLSDMQEYDTIIVDTDFNIKSDGIKIINKSSEVVLVSDGSTIANVKTERGLQALRILDDQRESHMIQKMQLFYNKFSNKTGVRISELPIECIGGAPIYSGYTCAQISQNISKIKELDKI